MTAAVLNTLEKQALQRLLEGASIVPKTWHHMVRTYESLIEKGLAKEVKQKNQLLRHFEISKDEP